LFYFELVFAVYVSILCGIFTLWQHWSNPKKIAGIYAIQFVGGATALVLLFVQLTAALGLNVVVKDFSATFLARNASAANTSALALVEFFHDNNIVFWQNFRDGASLRTLSAFAKSIGTSVFQIWTPSFSVMVLVPFIGIVVSFCERSSGRFEADSSGSEARQSSRKDKGFPPISSSSSIFGSSIVSRLSRKLGLARIAELSLYFPSLRSKLGALVLFSGISLVVFEIFQPGLLFGVLPARSVARSNGELAVLAMSLSLSGLMSPSTYSTSNLTLALTVVAATMILFSYFVAPSLLPVCRGTLTCSLAAIVLITSPALFNQSYSEIWLLPVQEWKVRIVIRVATLMSFGAGLGIALCGASRSFGLVQKASFRRALAFFFVGFVSYAVIYILSPGYVMSGYAERFAPFAIFFLSSIPAIAICAMLLAGRRCSIWFLSNDSRIAQLYGRVFVPSGLIFAVSVVFLFWAKVQVYYAEIFPSNHLAFAKTLASPPFKNASFAVGNYAAVVAYYTRNWAYMDTMLGNAVIDLRDPAGGHLKDKSALWFADWNSNPAYESPTYSACMKTPNFDSVLALRAVCF
jgi:hypothetical protein